MKPYIMLIVVSLLIVNTASAQKLDYSPFEGKMDYALLEANCLYLPLNPIEVQETHKIWKKCLEPNSSVTLHYCLGPWSVRYPFVWVKSGERLFTVSIFGSSTGLANTYLTYRNFEQKDSATYARTTPADQSIPKELVWTTPLSDYCNSFFKQRRIPNSRETEAMYNTLDFDIEAPSPNLARFYLRDTTALYVWECQLPAAQNPEWKEIKVYASPKTNFEYPPLKHSKSYSGTKTVTNAITDSLFFQGHFKVIGQGTDKFIVNRQHGLIYHMGDTAIVRVGRVAVSDSYPAIRGKRLFIEDRDNGPLVFFAPVVWEDNPYPKPKVKVMTEKEMRDRFRYVLK